MRLTPQQAEIARSLVFGKKKFHGVKAAGKVGKSTVAAMIVFWVAECHGYARVNALSATGDNLSEVLWGEVRSFWERSQSAEYPLPASAEPPLDPKTGFDYCGCRIVGWTAAKVESLGGIGGAKQLFIIDEASSDRFDLLYDGIRHNTMSGQTRMLILGNPTRPTGTFHSLWHNSPERDAWELSTLASAERQPDGSIRALYDYPGTGLADKEEVLSLIRLMGVESDFVRVRVFGEFPLAGSNSVCSMEWINRATKRYSWCLDKHGNLDLEKCSKHLSEQLHLGVDVARFGDDDAVIYPRRGLLVLDPVIIHGMDTVQLVSAIVETVERLTSEEREPSLKLYLLLVSVLRALAETDRDPSLLLDVTEGIFSYCGVKVKIDTTGSAGAYDLLMETVKFRRNAKAAAKHGGKKYTGILIEAVPVCVSERATSVPDATTPGYMRLRDQLWFAGAYFLRDGGILKPHPKLEEDLLAPTYKYDASGKYLVESKADVKKRLKRSPDLADAFCMAVYDGPSAVPWTHMVDNKAAPAWGSVSVSEWGGGYDDHKPAGI